MKYLPYFLAGLFFVTLSLTAIFRYHDIHQSFVRFLANNLNLTIQHLYISGVENTNIEKLNKAINLQKNDSIFKDSSSTIRKRIEELPWVRLAHVQRILPNAFKIDIIEHKGIATIKFNNQRWALNSKGNLIDIVDDSFNYLLELSGEESKENASGLFSLFADWTDLLFLAKQAEFIGKRRWNLYLENGTLIMLPEEGVRHSLKVLKVLHNQQKILKKQRIKIDLRNVEKHIIIDEQTNRI
jgi:cell division protein FtsQ